MGAFKQIEIEINEDPDPCKTFRMNNRMRKLQNAMRYKRKPNQFALELVAQGGFSIELLR